MRARSTTLALLLLVTVLMPGCGPVQRPSFESWTPTWESTVAIIPSASFAVSPDDDTCNHVVARLREAQEDLLPTPDRALDVTVREWMEVAEQTFFECPPKEGETVGFEAAYAQLERIQVEIDAAIAADVDLDN